MARVRYTRQPVSFVLESVRKQKGRERKRMNEWDLEHCHCCGSYARRCWRWLCLCFSCPGHVLGCLKLNAFKQLNVITSEQVILWKEGGRWKVKGRSGWSQSMRETCLFGIISHLCEDNKIPLSAATVMGDHETKLKSTKCWHVHPGKH